MRRVIIIAAAVFLAGILGYVGYGAYNDKIKPFREVIIKVNDTSFTMGYYVKMLDAYTEGAQPSQLYYMANLVANQIVQDELIRQGAENLGISVEAREIDEKLEENKMPTSKLFRDIVAATILREKLLENYFGSRLPDTMEQAHIQVMLVESEEVADEVITRVKSDEDFAALIDEFSCNPQTEGDLGWLPQELMSNSLIGDAVFSSESNELSKIYDGAASKNIGYWFIEVTDKDEEKGIKARAILLGSREKADEVKAELTDENFAELGKEHSQYKGEGEGGELGWLKKGDMHSDAFDEAAFNLDLNVISEPVKDESVQTTGGYWVVKVLEKGEHELSDEVRNKLARNDFTEWLQEQRESSTINNYLDEGKKQLAVERVLEGK
jgi:parvulin-like peptidyl-prolyl isomerase